MNIEQSRGELIEKRQVIEVMDALTKKAELDLNVDIEAEVWEILFEHAAHLTSEGITVSALMTIEIDFLKRIKKALQRNQQHVVDFNLKMIPFVAFETTEQTIRKKLNSMMYIDLKPYREPCAKTVLIRALSERVA